MHTFVYGCGGVGDGRTIDKEPTNLSLRSRALRICAYGSLAAAGAFAQHARWSPENLCSSWVSEKPSDAATGYYLGSLLNR